MGVCAEPGCPDFATDHGRCGKHRRLVTGTGSRPSVRGPKRRRILKRDGYRCTWIEGGKRCTRTANLHIDHVIPVTAGGTDDDGNLRTLCARHNLKKGAQCPPQMKGAMPT